MLQVTPNSVGEMFRSCHNLEASLCFMSDGQAMKCIACWNLQKKQNVWRPMIYIWKRPPETRFIICQNEPFLCWQEHPLCLQRVCEPGCRSSQCTSLSWWRWGWARWRRSRSWRSRRGCLRPPQSCKSPRPNQTCSCEPRCTAGSHLPE